MNRRIPFVVIRRSLNTQQPVVLNSTTYGDPQKDRALPPLVVLHGLFGQKTNWNSVAKALHRKVGSVVYTLDMRNHGASPRAPTMSYADQAADVVEFIRKKRKEDGFEKMNLLGHSMGGKAAMRLAVDPNGASLLSKLIIEDVSPKGYSPSSVKFRDYIAAMRNIDMRQSRRDIQAAMEPSIPELAIRQFLLTNLQAKDDGIFEWKCNIDVIDEHVDDILGFSIPSGVFRGPTLFLYGGNSNYVPDDHRPTIQCFFPQVKFESIPNAGHWVHAEQPTNFVDSVARFLKE